MNHQMSSDLHLVWRTRVGTKEDLISRRFKEKDGELRGWALFLRRQKLLLFNFED